MVKTRTEFSKGWVLTAEFPQGILECYIMYSDEVLVRKAEK